MGHPARRGRLHLGRDGASMSATAPPRANHPAASDVEPVQHETLRPDHHRCWSRRCRCSRNAAPRWHVWEGTAVLQRRDRLRHALRADRARCDRGLPPPLTHRSFQGAAAGRASWLLGSAAIEGPVISWVADHRKHHAFSDQPGDPHSPHVDHGVGWTGALRGLLHAHVGWLFVHDQRGRSALRAGPARRPGHAVRRPDVPRSPPWAGSPSRSGSGSRSAGRSRPG